MTPRALCALAAVTACVALGEIGAEPLEPPPEAPEGADYEVERADSLDGVELVVGASGSAGTAPRRTRQVRFSGDSLDGALRAGEDPLAGGSLEGRGRAAEFGIGRLSPRWGRGLVVGAAAEPWSMNAADRGGSGALRGKSGEGVWVRPRAPLRCEMLYGRFARRDLAGATAAFGPVSLGSLTDATGTTQGSLWIDRGLMATEAAVDTRGRWRAEGAMRGTAGEWSVAARARGGHADFRSVAEPQRTGPARAYAVALARPGDSGRWVLFGSWWRFAPGAAGARAAVDWERRTALGALAAGFEEHHGLRRAPSAARVPDGFRQGWWSEWRGEGPGLALAVRHEAWGRRPFARDPVRVVTVVRAESALPAGAWLRVTHTVHRVASGEHVYLPEHGIDRLVLRAVTGIGERTRIDLRVPAAGGAVAAAVELAGTTTRASRARWTLHWIRRTRLGSKR